MYVNLILLLHSATMMSDLDNPKCDVCYVYVWCRKNENCVYDNEEENVGVVKINSFPIFFEVENMVHVYY